MLLKVEDLCLIGSNGSLATIGYNKSSFILEHNCHLVAGLFPNEFRNDPNLYLCSSLIELYRLIFKYLRCSFEIAESNKGGLKVDNRWTGIFALFEQNRIDFIANQFSLSGNRQELIEIDVAIPQKDMLTILSSPKKRVHSNSPFRLFACFDWPVWTMIFVSFILGAVVNTLANHQHQHHNGCRNSHHKEITQLFRDSLWNMLVVLMGQELSQWNLRHLPRTQLCLWLLVTFLFRQLFSGQITAVLLSATTTIIDRFDQLADISNLTVIAKTGTISYKHLIKLYPWIETKVIGTEYEDLSTIKTVQRLEDGTTVLITNRERIELIKNFYSNRELHVSRQGIASSLLTYPVSKVETPVPSIGLNQSQSKTNRKRVSYFLKWLHYLGIVNRSNKLVWFNNLNLAHREYPHLGIEQLIAKLVDSGRNSRNCPKSKSCADKKPENFTETDKNPENSDTSTVDDPTTIDNTFVLFNIYFVGIALAFGGFVGEILGFFISWSINQLLLKYRWI